MAIVEIAKGLVSLCKEGKFSEAISTYYGDDIVSVEPMGENPETHGIEAIKAKSEWFASNMEVHELAIEGPYINGDQFGVRFTLDATEKGSGKRSKLDEFGVYTVKDDKIVHERFLYATP